MIEYNLQAQQATHAERNDVKSDIMTPEEVADYLRLNRETVYRNLRRGQLPGIKVGSQWRVSRSALDSALNHPGLHKESLSADGP